MYTSFYKRGAAILLFTACALSTFKVAAQNKKTRTEKQEEIVIKKNSDKDEKMTIVIDGDKVTVNGKPVTDFNGNDVLIRKLNKTLNEDLADIDEDVWSHAPMPPFPPMPPMPPNPTFHIEADGFSMNGDDVFINTTTKPMLGVYTEKDEKGAKITNVVDDSPAAKAGLIKGDIIIKVGDKKITDPSTLSDIIGDMKPNDAVDIVYLRDKKEKKLTLKLGERKESFSKSFNYNAPQFNDDLFRYKFDGPGMFNKKPRLGIRIQDVEEGNGVKVIDLEDSSAAAKSGIKKDDIITSIDGAEIKNTDDAREKMSEVKDKASYPVKVLRSGTVVNIEVKIPKKLKTTDL